ncbi:MAG: hypothetical protein EA402_04440 [Planctomycetota bacterium]|nr:MAG: hypothetical protein EA402_04440 [Planctomycetota bacterium]
MVRSPCNRPRKPQRKYFPMPIITITCSVLLILSSIIFSVASSSESMTIFIPAFFGAPLLLLGIILLKMQSPARKHVAHVAAAIALLGALMGLAMGIPRTAKLAMSGEGNPLAASLTMILGVLCLIIVIAAVRSFIAARKARQNQPSAS